MDHIRTDEGGLVQACPACGQKNRVPYDRIGQEGRCGKCGAGIPAPAAPIDVADEGHFNRLIAGALPVVVDFWAPWCGPCRMVAPELEKVAAGADGRFVVAKVNTQALQGLAGRLNVMSIPTLAVFAGGREAVRTVGARPAPAIRAFIDQSLSSAATR